MEKVLGFGFWVLLIWICLEFRILNFGFYPSKKYDKTLPTEFFKEPYLIIASIFPIHLFRPGNKVTLRFFEIGSGQQSLDI